MLTHRILHEGLLPCQFHNAILKNLVYSLLISFFLRVHSVSEDDIKKAILTWSVLMTEEEEYLVSK